MADAIPTAASTAIAKAGSRFTLLAILLIVLGVLALLSPLYAGKFIAYLVGAFVLVGGVVSLLHIFRSGGFWRGVWALLVGVAMVIGGLVMLTHPLLNLMALTLLVAIYFVVEGIFTLVAGLGMTGKPGCGFVLFNGVVTLLLGVLIWAEWPISGVWAIGVLVGIHLLLTGMQLLAVGSTAKQLAKAA